MKKLLLITGALAFILGGCGGADDTEDPAMDDDGAMEEEAADDGGSVSAEEGMALYEQNCMSCHGGDFEGMSGPALEGYSEDEVLAAIQEGPGSMPADIVTGEDADAVAKYVAEEG
ncbi:cytochrome c [Geomicrobium sp. JCM 19038]|uniref:c-type cytochrome n=1 Tax=Geomicrobium sp. JCM 19038 TaxID=1460635 RepID=UPI00045F2961|nr:cytochrome c [Geomicrobium sp. JCM 19038]GAK07236.1 cytochrome c551 [Geomicrobium sp. JCM 19038]